MVFKRQLTIVLFLILSLALPGHAESMSPEELVARHVNAIGSKQALSEVKSRAVTGQVQYRILSGGQGGVLDGSSTLLTEGRKLLLYIKLPNNEYRGERFIFDGSNLEVRLATAQNRRSLFGDFVHTQDVVIREGLLGGVLSTAWPLLNLDEHKPKLSYEGEKILDGEKLLALKYQPRKGSDLSIHLYFDPQSFHHVRTVYSLTVHPSFVTGRRGASERASAAQTESHYLLEERFSDFKTVDGLTLPAHYVIQYSDDSQRENIRPVQTGGGSVLSQWDAREEQVQQNVSPDPRNFQVR